MSELRSIFGAIGYLWVVIMILPTTAWLMSVVTATMYAYPWTVLPLGPFLFIIPLGGIGAVRLWVDWYWRRA